MSRPTRQIAWMIVGIVAAAFIAVLLWDKITAAFWHNAPLNAFILAVLTLGIVFSFWQVLRLNADIGWIEHFRTGGHSRNFSQPRLLAPLAAMLKDRTTGRISISALALRSVLDGIQARLDESREISRYLMSLLIFLGLLGTFWGLLGTINSVADAIRDMKVTGVDPATTFEALKQSLEGPLAGMGIAFSASLFGLAGSLLLGYLELQTGQAQNRFFNELEDWLSGQTRLSAGSGISESDQPVPAYIQALLEQTAESLENLQRTMARTEEGRSQANQNFKMLGEQMVTLTDQLRTEQQLMLRMAEGQNELRGVLGRLGEAASSGGLGIDANSRAHLRNIDALLARVADDMVQGRSAAVQDLRSEIKVLTRTIAVAAGIDRPAGQ